MKLYNLTNRNESRIINKILLKYFGKSIKGTLKYNINIHAHIEMNEVDVPKHLHKLLLSTI